MKNSLTWKHELQTPSFAFSALGILLLIVSVVFKRRQLEVPAFCLFGTAGAGGVRSLCGQWSSGRRRRGGGADSTEH